MKDKFMSRECKVHFIQSRPNSDFCPHCEKETWADYMIHATSIGLSCKKHFEAILEELIQNNGKTKKTKDKTPVA